MDFPQIVKQLRQERGWSQQEVADRVGLNKMTISQYENGKKAELRDDRSVPPCRSGDSGRDPGDPAPGGPEQSEWYPNPGKPFVYGKYYILIVPFSHTA